MVVGHPLLESNVKRAIECAASRHLGRRWVSHAFTNLNERASHPCGVLHGEPFSVIAKLGIGDNAEEKFQTELSGLTLLRDRARIAIPTPIGTGLLQLDQVHDERFGLEKFNGFFGPLAQDIKPVTSNRWVDFYSERRVVPLLRSAIDAGQLPKDLARYVERLVDRLPSLCGPEPQPTLLHGDAQQHNFVTTDDGAVVADAAPYFGHRFSGLLPPCGPDSSRATCSTLLTHAAGTRPSSRKHAPRIHGVPARCSHSTTRAQG